MSTNLIKVQKRLKMSRETELISSFILRWINKLPTAQRNRLRQKTEIQTNLIWEEFNKQQHMEVIIILFTYFIKSFH